MIPLLYQLSYAAPFNERRYRQGVRACQGAGPRRPRRYAAAARLVPAAAIQPPPSTRSPS